MKNLLRMELSKAIRNKFFITVLIIGVCIVVFQVVMVANGYTEHLETMKMVDAYHGYATNPETHAYNLFNKWIGVEFNSIAYSIFYLILPLMVALPYGWSYVMERKQGYTKNIYTRTSKKAYIFSKYCAVFVSGGLVVFIPLLVNFLLNAMFIPTFLPDASYIYYPIWQGSIWSSVYYTQPFLYVLGYLLIDFVFSGLMAALSLGCTVFLKNRLAVVTTPFLIVLGIHYIHTISYLEISSIHFLHAGAVDYPIRGWIIFAEGFLFFLFSFAMSMGLGRKDEIT